MFSIKSKLLIIFIILTYCRLVNAADHFLCSYGIYQYIYYKSDGTKVVVDNPAPADPTIATKIFDFIYPKVKLAVSGKISGIEGIPYAAKGIPYLAYDSGGLFNTDPISGGTWGTGHLNPNPPDSYFLYDSFTQSKLIMSKYGTSTYPIWIYDPTNSDLRNRYIDYLKTVADPQPSGCGIFMDDAFGYLPDYAWTRLVSESKVINYLGSTGYLYINSSHNLSPRADGVDYKVLDPANNDAEMISIGCWQNPYGMNGFNVYFDNPAYDKKTVTLKFYERITKNPPYQVAHSDFTPIDDTAYRNGMTSFLQLLKGKVGNNQLVFYNGSIPNLQIAKNYDYDVDFLKYADGCMAENIFNPNNWHADSDKTLWKAGLDKEIQIAALNKKLLSLNYTTAESDSDIIKDMFLYYASFLLGAGNGSMFSFTSKLGQFMWFDFYDYDIGVPSGPYTKSIDSNTGQPFDADTYVFQRSFTNSLALVNVEPITLTAKVPTENYYYYDTNWALNEVSSSITIPPRTGVVLFNKAPTTTSVQTTSTVLPPTTTSVQTTSTVLPPTTTSVQTTSTVLPPTTTTLKSLGGGGGGGGGSTSTTIIAVKPTTTTIVQSTTTTTIIATECTTDTDCDDSLFCNGVERCDNGICIQGSNPCQAEQICSESRNQCVNVSKKIGTSFPVTIRRPVFTDEQTKLMIVKTIEDNYFDKTISSVIFSNSGNNSQGVKLDDIKKTFKLKTWFGSFIFLPVRVYKQATVGHWEILINTGVSGRNPIEERVYSTFIIK
jgi:hypothetical protein